MGVLKNTFIEQLTLRGFSEKTIKAYTYYVNKLAFYYNIPPINLTEKQVRDFFVYLKEVEKLSPISYNLYHASIRYFFSIFDKEYLMKSTPRCKNHKSKPAILSKEEVIRIIDSITNIKHKAIISLLYSAGLRIGEAIQLKITDIDRERKQIFIKNAKGNKDRYAILSQKSLEILEIHIKKNNPIDYLFYSEQNVKAPIHTRTVQKVFKDAKNKAGISKNVTPHTFRHSFATHLLEDGINLRYIQTLLGHANLTSTAIYLHTVSLDKLNVVSPFDTNK